jgi:hypothetical protein
LKRTIGLGGNKIMEKHKRTEKKERVKKVTRNEGRKRAESNKT